jgi:hypothetical protein
MHQIGAETRLNFKMNLDSESPYAQLCVTEEHRRV